MIARAADGSVRDGLSLLDHAIALAGDIAAGRAIDAEIVRDMLGIADRGLVWELFETVLRGDAAGALAQMDALYQGGADPQIVLQDLLDLTHFVTRLKLAPDAGAGDPLEEGDRDRALVARRGAVDAGIDARLADAAERHRGAAVGAGPGAGRFDGADPPRLRCRPAGAGRPGPGRDVAWMPERVAPPLRQMGFQRQAIQSEQAVVPLSPAGGKGRGEGADA